MSRRGLRANRIPQLIQLNYNSVFQLQMFRTVSASMSRATIWRSIMLFISLSYFFYSLFFVGERYIKKRKKPGLILGNSRIEFTCFETKACFPLRLNYLRFDLIPTRHFASSNPTGLKPSLTGLTVLPHWFSSKLLFFLYISAISPGSLSGMVTPLQHRHLS